MCYYISRLDNDQIKMFVEGQFPHERGYRYSFYYMTEDDNTTDCDYIRLTVYREHSAYHETIYLSDFDVMGNICRKAWLKFMYLQFGKLYYEDYKKIAMSVFD